MATTKTATKKATTKKTTAKTATPKQAPARGSTSTAKRPPRLLERDPQLLLEDAGYAVAGLAHDAVERARTLRTRLETWRGEVEKTAKDAPERVKDLRTEVPTRVETTVKDVRVRISKELQARLDGFEKGFDDKAANGRKVAEDIRMDERIKRVLEQTGNTRSQVKGAITSVVRTGSAAAEAGREQADTAASQVKAAATSTRKSAETLTDAATDVATDGSDE